MGDCKENDLYEGDIVKLVKGDGYGCLSQKNFVIKFGSYTCPFGEGYSGENEYGFYAERDEGGYVISIAGANEIFELQGNIFQQ